MENRSNEADVVLGFGEYLKDLLVGRDLTAADLARLLTAAEFGTSDSLVQKWTRDERLPRADGPEVHKIAEVLGLAKLQRERLQKALDVSWLPKKLPWYPIHRLRAAQQAIVDNYLLAPLALLLLVVLLLPPTPTISQVLPDTQDVRTSFRQDRISGVSFVNPLLITLPPVTGSARSATYYVAIYDKSGGVITSDVNFLSTITSRLSNPYAGVLLAYDTQGTRCDGGQYCVYATTQWADISRMRVVGYPVLDSSGYPLYWVFPGKDRQWRISFATSFVNRDMSVATYVSADGNRTFSLIGHYQFRVAKSASWSYR